jgi:hypothetical protein
VVVPTSAEQQDRGDEHRNASRHLRYLISSTVETLPSP